MEQSSSLRSTSGLRASPAVNSVEKQPSSVRSTGNIRSSHSNSLEQIPSSHSLVAGRSTQSNSLEQIPSNYSVVAGRASQSASSVDEAQPPSASNNSAVSRTSLSNGVEQPLSARSHSRPNLGVKTVPMVPPAVPLSLRSNVSTIPAEVQPDSHKDKRYSFYSFKCCTLGVTSTLFLMSSIGNSRILISPQVLSTFRTFFDSKTCLC